METMTDDMYEKLSVEAIYLHQSLFDFSPSLHFVELYVQSQISLGFVNSEEQQLRSLKKIIDLKLPVEPLELVLRKKNPLLSKKLNSIVYIAETIDGYRSFFYSDSKNFFYALCKISFACMRIPFSYTYGLYLGKRHGLI